MPFLDHLPVLGLAVEGELLGVLGRVELAHVAPDARLTVQAFHAEGAPLVRNDGHHALADGLVAHEHLEDLHQGHGGGDLAILRRAEQPVERRQRRDRERLGAAPALGAIAAQLAPPRLHVLVLLRALRELDVGDVGQLLVRDRHLEPIPEPAHRLGGHLLQLVGDVHGLAGLAHPVALDGLGQDDGGLPGVLRGRVEGGVDLERIVPAAVQAPDVLVRELGHQVLELGRVEEVLADVGAVARAVHLVLAVDDLHHAVPQLAVLVLGEERVPVAPPDHLDDVPARAAERPLQLLDDLSVARAPGRPAAAGCSSPRRPGCRASRGRPCRWRPWTRARPSRRRRAAPTPSGRWCRTGRGRTGSA